MAKFYGKVGYVETVETRPGVFTQSVTVRIAAISFEIAASGKRAVMSMTM